LSGIGKGFPLRKICDSWGLGLIRTEGMPYSNDLRLRVLAAVDGGVPVRQVAALLRVSVSYIYKALNLLFGLGSISMAGVEQAIAWQAHIGGFLSVSWHSPHSIPFRSRRAAARMKAWTRRPQRSILIQSPARSARNATALKAPLRVRCECGARGDTCAWRLSSCADWVNLSVFVSCCGSLRGARCRRATQSFGHRHPAR